MPSRSLRVKSGAVGSVSTATDGLAVARRAIIVGVAVALDGEDVGSADGVDVASAAGEDVGSADRVDVASAEEVDVASAEGVDVADKATIS